ncbi:MAG: polyphosphate kinase 1 [Fusobacteriaceae bacterium]
MDINRYKSDDFFNRDLSWLEFNYRVLEAGMNLDNPLLERAKFIAIVSSNLDEFFKVRVAGLKAQEDFNLDIKDIAGFNSKEQLIKIKKKVSEITRIQSLTHKNLLEEMEEKCQIKIKTFSELTAEEIVFLEGYYEEIIFPILTPMAVDGFHPLPNLNGGALHLIIKAKKNMGISFALVEIPKVINRLISLPNKDKKIKNFILIEDVVKNNISSLFNGYEISDFGFFRITRDEDLSIKQLDEAEDLLKVIEKEIKHRKWGNPVRVEHSNLSEFFLKFLTQKLNIENKIFYCIDGALDLSYLFKISELNGYENFKFPFSLPKFHEDLRGEKIFDYMKKRAILLHHPFESFDHILDFIETAASDPKVLAIKQTFYRLSGDSPIIKSLIKAAESGKQVTVLVELKARFDEERNVRWAKQLEDAGCHVIYGLSGLKTHAKCLLIIRQEDEGIRRYVHLSTGNYNDSTAKIYVDTSLFTTDDEIGADISHLFNKLTGFSKVDNWKKIIVAPTHLREKLYSLIENEIQNKQRGQDAKIIAKVNGLTDRGIIEKLYDASKVGVDIILIVRGACCLKSGIKKISENIKVYSLVGRYLEHDRIYHFQNGSNPIYYLSSADLMERNLDSRLEIMIPVDDKIGKKRLHNFLNDILRDNCNLQIQKNSGSYIKIEPELHSKKFNYQEHYRKKTEN